MLAAERTKLLAYWINERELIRIKKEAAQPQPWTDDVILRNYRFCNVRREDDRVTRWIAQNWRTPYNGHSNFTAAMVLARLLNNPECLSEIGFPVLWNDRLLREKIKARRDHGLKILNPAYVVTTCGVSMDKVDYIVDLASTVQHFVAKSSPPFGSLESYHHYLMKFKGLGTFLAGQVVADLKNTPGHPLKNAPDWWTWAAVGPGSLRGLRVVLAQPDVSQRHFLALARNLYVEVLDVYDGKLNICMQDFQNCLCEFSKYWKAYNDEGQPKQRYHASR